MRALDDGLREMGVGDLVVGKRMRKLGEAFYGRMRAIDDALALAPQTAVLAELMERTVLLQGPKQGAAALAAYAVRAADSLDRQPLEALLGGAAEWPGTPA